MWGVENLAEALLGDGGELERLVALELCDHLVQGLGFTVYSLGCRV